MKFMVQGKLENKKIGVLGGSFDPAHVGHVRISKLAKKNYNLSQVISVSYTHLTLPTNREV